MQPSHTAAVSSQRPSSGNISSSYSISPQDMPIGTKIKIVQEILSQQTCFLTVILFGLKNATFLKFQEMNLDFLRNRPYLLKGKWMILNFLINFFLNFAFLGLPFT